MATAHTAGMGVAEARYQSFDFSEDLLSIIGLYTAWSTTLKLITIDRNSARLPYHRNHTMWRDKARVENGGLIPPSVQDWIGYYWTHNRNNCGRLYFLNKPPVTGEYDLTPIDLGVTAAVCPIQVGQFTLWRDEACNWRSGRFKSVVRVSDSVIISGLRGVIKILREFYLLTERGRVYRELGFTYHEFLEDATPAKITPLEGVIDIAFQHAMVFVALNREGQFGGPDGDTTTELTSTYSIYGGGSGILKEVILEGKSFRLAIDRTLTVGGVNLPVAYSGRIHDISISSEGVYLLVD